MILLCYCNQILGDILSQQENLSGRLIVTTAADQHDHKFPALTRLANNQFCC